MAASSQERIPFNSTRLSLAPYNGWSLLPADQLQDPLLDGVPFDLAFTRQPGASLSFSFYGSTLDVFGVLSPNATEFQATLDGVEQDFTPCKPSEAAEEQQMVQVVNLNTADEHTLTLTHVGSDQQFLGIQSLLVRHPTAHTPVYIPSGPGARAHTSSSSLSSSSSTSSHIPPASSTVSRKTKHGGHHTKHAGKASATPATSPFAVSYSACPASSASSSSSSSSPSSAPPRSNSASSSSTSGLLNTEAAQTASSDDTSPGAIAGATIGGLAALALLGLLGALALKRFRKQKQAANRSSTSSSATDPAFVVEALPATRPPNRRAVTDSSWVGFGAGEKSDFSHGSSDEDDSVPHHHNAAPALRSSVYSGPSAIAAPHPPSDQESDWADFGMTWDPTATAAVGPGAGGGAHRLSRSGTMTDPFRRNPERQLSVRNPDMWSQPDRSSVSMDAPRHPYRPSVVDSLDDSEVSSLDRLPAHSGLPTRHSASQGSLGTPMEVQDVAFGIGGLAQGTTVSRRLSYF